MPGKRVGVCENSSSWSKLIRILFFFFSWTQELKAEVTFAKIIPFGMLVGVLKKRQWEMEVYSFKPSILSALHECVCILHSEQRMGWDRRGVGEEYMIGASGSSLGASVWVHADCVYVHVWYHFLYGSQTHLSVWNVFALPLTAFLNLLGLSTHLRRGIIWCLEFDSNTPAQYNKRYWGYRWNKIGWELIIVETA